MAVGSVVHVVVARPICLRYMALYSMNRLKGLTHPPAQLEIMSQRRATTPWLKDSTAGKGRDYEVDAVGAERDQYLCANLGERAVARDMAPILLSNINMIHSRARYTS